MDLFAHRCCQQHHRRVLRNEDIGVRNHVVRVAFCKNKSARRISRNFPTSANKVLVRMQLEYQLPSSRNLNGLLNKLSAIFVFEVLSKAGGCCQHVVTMRKIVVEE